MSTDLHLNLGRNKWEASVLAKFVLSTNWLKKKKKKKSITKAHSHFFFFNDYFKDRIEGRWKWRSLKERGRETKEKTGMKMLE